MSSQNKVCTPEDALRWRKVIGEDNYQASLRALADGASIWIFTTRAEIDADPDLCQDEKKQVTRILAEEGLGYAGWFRYKEPEPVPGYLPDTRFNVHGDAQKTNVTEHSYGTHGWIHDC